MNCLDAIPHLGKCVFKGIAVIFDTLVTELIGDEELKAIKTLNTKTQAVSTLDVNGLFVAIGQQPANRCFKNLTRLNEAGYIISSEKCLTDTQGVFVAGDCRTKEVRQVTTAAADGAVAALAACKYIDAM